MAEQAVIRELSDLEAVQMHASMYIGDTTYATHLLLEAIDNARDECLSGYSNRIDVISYIDKTTNDYWYITRDYGRGISISSPYIEGDVIQRICTKLHSGGKFRDGNMSGYEFSSGIHGVGTVAINALSKQLIITTKNTAQKDTYWQYFFENGIFKKKQLIRLTSKNNEPLYSTEVRFTPNPKYFVNPYCDEQIIKNVLSIARYGLENIIITYQNKEIEDNLLETFKGDNCIELISGNFTSKTTKETCKIDIARYEDYDSGKIFKGIVNLLQTDEGNHCNIVFNMLKNKLFDIAQKNKKHLQLNDILIPIRVLCTLKIKEPRFPAQTKGKLVTPKDQLEPLIEPVIDNLIKKNKEFFEKIIDVAEEYRVNLQSNKNARAFKTNSKIVKVAGLKDCISKNPNECSLYLVEGNSAGGCAVGARNPKTEAILSLRGKTLNVIADKATKSKVMENQVINTIAAALGIKLYQPIDINKLRYREIYLLSDADFDGYHISCLLITTFYELFNDIVKAGRLYIIRPPLYGTTINKKFIPIYDEKTRREYDSKGYITKRFKGLSEMNVDELREAAFNHDTRQCIQLQYEDFDMKNLWKEKLGILKMESYKS